jgi:ABC-type lipoprotein release transport system permease subunit
MMAFLYTADFAIRGLLRRKAKNLSIVLLFALIVFLFSGMDFMSNALYRASLKALDFQPSIIVQKVTAGRQVPISRDSADAIAALFGVSEVRARVWGYHFDPHTGANYTVVGAPEGLVGSIPGVLPEDSPSSSSAAPRKLQSGEALAGQGILTARDITIGDELYFSDSDGKPAVFTVRGAFSSQVSLWTYDLIVIPEGDAARLFGMNKETAWDIAVSVPNELEVANVGEKIIARIPGARVIAASQLKRTYGSSYGFRSGVVLATSLTCLLAFLILAYDRVAGLSREEQKELAVLKAVGWKNRDIIRMNMLQGLVLSLTGFLIGTVLAYYYVFAAGAPLLRTMFSGWSVMFPSHPLPPYLDLSKVFGLMFLTVVPFVTVGIVPIWRAAVRDPEEIFRS